MFDSQKLQNSLRGLLTENEQKVYVAALQGVTTVQQLARRAGLDRSNTYRTITSLVDKGLLVQEIKKHGRLIAPAHPQKLAHLAGKLQRKLRRQEIALKGIIPDLLSAYHTDDLLRPRVRFYEGKEGWLDVSRQTLESGVKEILFIASIEDIYRYADQKEYDEQFYIPARIERGIKFRQLVVKCPVAIEQQKRDLKELRETRFLSQTIHFKGTKFVYGNEVAYMTAGEPLIGIVITSNLLAEMERVLFEELWQQAE